MTKISVIMPTYNRANIIEKSIQSILNQTYKDFELLILDDGSTDHTKEVIKKYLSDSRVKYYYHENQGEAETVNYGWSLAKGEYFTQVNSDDTLTPNSFEVMVKQMDKHKKYVLAYPDFNFIDENDKIIFTTKSPDWKFEKALKSFSCYAASAGTFIRRKAFKDWKKIKRSRFKHINDIEMYWDMALVGNFLHIGEVLANWRVHSGQISKDRYKSIPEIEQWYNYYFNKDNLPEKIKKLKNKTRKSILYYYLDLINKSSLLKDEKKELVKPYREELGMKNYNFSCLQIGDTDLIGNKFNGYDLHKYLEDNDIESNYIVRNKISKDYSVAVMEKPFAYNILKSDLFAKADIIHFHLIHNTDFDLTMLPIYSKLKPLVITLHDPYFTTGHCLYSYRCEKWRDGCFDCPKLDIPFKIDFDTSALEYKIKKEVIQNSEISAIVASDYMEKIVKESPIWKNKKVYKLPFGINLDIFKPYEKQKVRKQLGINKQDFVIMFRATNIPFKGFDTIKNSLTKLKTDKHITIITIQEKGLLKKLKKKYNIKEYGWIYDDKKLAKLYQASDLFLMPSEQEAFGMMAIEAMSCKVPVLSIKGTSLESITNSPQCGFCPDKKDFTKTLQYLIDNPQIVEQTAQNAYKLAKENYNKDTYIKKMIEIYKDIIRTHKIDKDWENTLNQMNKYNIDNYFSGNIFPFAKNCLWRIIYSLIVRPILKIIYGKKQVQKKYDIIYKGIK